MIPYTKGEQGSSQQVGQIPAGYTQGSGTIVSGTTATKATEAALAAYPGGVVVPLSTFDPTDIPDPQGKEVVFACRSGKRSVTASLAAQAAGFAYDRHLAGGMLGWKAAGLPTKSGG